MVNEYALDPLAAQAAQKLPKMVGAEKLNAEMAAAAKYIPKHVDIYRRMGLDPFLSWSFPQRDDRRDDLGRYADKDNSASTK